MEIDEDCNSNQTLFKKPTTPGLSFRGTAGTAGTSNNPTTATTIRFQDRIVSVSSGRLNSLSQMSTPIRSHQRRGSSSSGILFNNMFCGYFRHLKRLHLDSTEGLNAIHQPPTARAVFRSSLPATPIATPIYRESFPYFTEQALLERLYRTTPSPRRGMGSRNSYHSSNMDTDEGQQQQPMDICSPTIDEEDSPSGSSPNVSIRENTSFKSDLDSIYYKINDQFNPD